MVSWDEQRIRHVYRRQRSAPVPSRTAKSRPAEAAEGGYRAAVATKRLRHERGEYVRAECVRAEWIAAYAELPPMDWPINAG
jgi:hypothetical protein